jgi:hypothetical protein
VLTKPAQALPGLLVRVSLELPVLALLAPVRRGWALTLPPVATALFLPLA